MSQPKLRTIPLAKLTPDDKNANKGTKRGRKALGSSLARHGAMRSIAIDKADRVISGNKTLEAAKAAGYKEVLIVETDGKTLVAVKRPDLDLTTPEGRAAAIADNRTSELDLDWDRDILADLSKTLDFGDLWNADELNGLLGLANEGRTYLASDGKMRYSVVVDCKDEKGQKTMYERLSKEGFACQLLIS